MRLLTRLTTESAGSAGGQVRHYNTALLTAHQLYRSIGHAFPSTH